jgi:hypothetical protein
VVFVWLAFPRLKRARGISRRKGVIAITEKKAKTIALWLTVVTAAICLLQALVQLVATVGR